jgi:hypothetical protein
MVKTESTSSKSGDTEGTLPTWAEEEIKSVQFGQPEILTRTGYILDIYEKEFKIDIQLYEALPDSRTIIEGLDVPRSMKIADFMKGFVYEFKIKMFKAPLSTTLVQLLKKNFELEMDAIYRFELQEMQMMDVESDVAATTSTTLGEGDDNGEF